MAITDGVININKPEGWTSQDVCAKLRHRLHIRRIGHTGTLDPMATGVLPVCIGKATRIIEYYDQDIKSYHAEMQLGIVTDTLDRTGEILEENSFENVTDEMVLAAFRSYTGPIRQIPPKYSALKINGRRAYDLARSGESFDIKPRQITIYANDISSMDLSAGRIEFDVRCSKGTYIRTICDDIGRELGCGAAMTALERTGSGYFGIGQAVGINKIVEMTDEEIEGLVIPMDETLMNLGKVELNDNRIIAFSNGNPSDVGYKVAQDSRFCSEEDRDTRLYRVYGHGRFLGIGSISRGTLIPEKVITGI